MADIAGAINGTDGLLYKRLDTGDKLMGGLTNNGTTFTTEVIEITNKSSGEKKTLMEGEGKQMVSHNIDVFYSDDEAYQEMIDEWENKTIGTYIFYYGVGDGVKGDLLNLMVAESNITAEENSPVSNNFTMQNSGDFTPYFTSQYLLDSDSEELLDSNGNQLLSAG